MYMWKGLETRLRYERAEPSGLAVLEQLHVESNSECSQLLVSHSQTHIIYI